MGVLALITRLADLAARLLDWLKVRRIEDRARAEEAARQLKEMVDALDRARRARDDRRADDARGPDELRATDGFRRD